ncbi:histidine phosphatase family protein [Egbenema bharatensis]|uniref:histidine phosphatase family protein n=1 Tax=Egbenema bharatensis TaxID=3463334 RepID=UPI003A8A4159
MAIVWFIRHAESEANAGLPTTNPATTRLTATGHEQAQSIAALFPQAPSLIVTSPYLRTQQTAEPTIERFPSVPQAEWRVQEFTFLSPERYQNTTTHERRPMVEIYWQRQDPFHIDGEGAESFAMFIDRVQSVRSQLIQLEDKFVGIFSHERFIRAVLWLSLMNGELSENLITPKAMQQFQSFIGSFRLPNGAILKYELNASEIRFSEIITSHLQ